MIALTDTAKGLVYINPRYVTDVFTEERIKEAWRNGRKYNDGTEVLTAVRILTTPVPGGYAMVYYTTDDIHEVVAMIEGAAQ